jgi:hypothetical protein
MGQISPHFHLEELVPQRTYQELGDKAIELLHPDLIPSLEALRVKLDLPMRINNWNSGGTFNFRGYRPDWYKGGAPKSFHRRGMAIDCDSPGTPMKELFVAVWDLRDWIMEHTKFRRIESFEDTPGWCHLDLGPNTGKDILVVRG